MNRLQLIWWGWEWSRWSIGFRRWPGTYARFYRWSIYLGPLEVRRLSRWPPRSS